MSEITKTVCTNVLGIPASKAIIKEYREDGMPSYVYDLYDANGKLLAANRYCIKDSDKQPFEALTVDEGCILDPPIELTDIVEEGV